jgi:glutamate-1-semialdehyde 2,1-aminomutase
VLFRSGQVNVSLRHLIRQVAIGSGLPVAAVLGTTEAFAAVEDGRAARAGTYHGNPLVTAAVRATFQVLRASDYAGFLSRGDRLRGAIEAAFRDCGVPASTSGFGSVFSLWLAEKPPRHYEEATRLVDPPLSLKLHLLLREHGVVTIPGGWARLFLSFAHGDAEEQRVVDAYRVVARTLRDDILRAVEARSGRLGLQPVQ